jgi:hypothetical protein
VGRSATTVKVRAGGAVGWWPWLFAVHAAAGAWFASVDHGSVWATVTPCASATVAVVAAITRRRWAVMTLPPAVACAAVSRVAFVWHLDVTTANKFYTLTAQAIIVSAAAILASVALSTSAYFEHARVGER